MKNILVCLDLAENTEKILGAAKAVSSKTGAQLSLLHTYQPYVGDISIPATISSLPIYNELENTYKSQLDEHVESAKKEGYTAVGIWETDGIHSALLRQATETEADLIVMGRTGKGGFMDKMIGSASTDIALNASCPVMVVPPQVKTVDFQQVVYATQLEYEEADILRDVVDLVKKLDAGLSFVKVSSQDQPDIQPDHQFVGQMTAELGIDPEDIAFRKNDNVLQGIEDYCDEVSADLLIVSTRERDFLEKYIINPSITKKLVLDTHVPLLVYHLK